jgi:flagellar motor protein MotB
LCGALAGCADERVPPKSLLDALADRKALLAQAEADRMSAQQQTQLAHADNGSIEGRAQNRRVEIVVQPGQPQL